MVSWKKGKRHQTSCWLTSWLKPSGKHTFFCSVRASSPFGEVVRSHSRVPRKRRRARSLAACCARPNCRVLRLHIRLFSLLWEIFLPKWKGFICNSGSYSLISYWCQGSPLIWFWNIFYHLLRGNRLVQAFYTFLRSAKSGAGFEDGVGDAVPG